MSAPRRDPFAAASAVADAVLYEGYVLYPYRASSRKNQLRWQFGVLCPRSFAEADGSERWRTRTECLLVPHGAAVLSVRVRLLQLQRRVVEGVEAAGPAAAATGAALGSGSARGARAGLEVDGERYVSFDEAVEVVVEVARLDLASLRLPPAGSGVAETSAACCKLEQRFTCEGGSVSEPILGRSGMPVGSIVRTRSPLEGRVLVSAAAIPGSEPLLRIAVGVENLTGVDPEHAGRRDDVLERSLIAVHTLLAVEGGRFVSLFDPPASAAEAAASCRNEGSFPVLVGEDDDVVLSSPIILYDHPAIAPESEGDLYDATEIDEILALRVLTLTEEEKAEARGTDRRAAAIIDRCEAMSAESWQQLHGAIRSPLGVSAAVDGPWPDSAASGPGEVASWQPLPGPDAETPWWDPAADGAVDPWTDSVLVGGVEVCAGTPLRLRPSRRADAQDVFLDGLTAVCAGVFRDVDGGVLVAVSLDDDPAAGELAWQGRHLFFHPDEVEPLVSGLPS